MNKQIRFIQLNDGWNAEPNAPEPKIEISGTVLKLSFGLNYFVFDAFTDTDIGVLTFIDCLQYRLGPPNDEGFYNYGQSRFKKYGVQWGEFYCIENSDWLHEFPDKIVISEFKDQEEYNHFLFYFCDETFECIAKEWLFKVV